jgi:hypothetical protein
MEEYCIDEWHMNIPTPRASGLHSRLHITEHPINVQKN